MDPQQHPYSTRIRHNITIKPACTRRDDHSIVPPELYPVFPPTNVVLHPDDASSKVFLAMARAFVAVDNRAMTIKDIAERAGRYGLVCQNLSAAAQAVTTYLRQHKARCDQQDDHPLLLSHTLSGTPADDDLVPALYSHSGGDSHPVSGNRLTNFRKGTAVWYLSRPTGVPCPFARAGIRLCDYVSVDLQKDEQKLSSRKRRLQEGDNEDEVCGQKRKRPLRGCVAAKKNKNSSDEERPPKVKLTLRLKPLLIKSTLSTSPPTPTIILPSKARLSAASSSATDVSKEDSDFYDCDEDSMPLDSSSEEDDESPHSQPDQPNKPWKENARSGDEEPWSLPPYPRRSISIPCYTPSVESAYCSTYNLPPSKYRDPFRRSPSLAVSVATPPPESEDELDDFHVTMKNMRRFQTEEEEEDLGWEADLDSEGDGETISESPGPRSPSAPLPLAAHVKEEPRDVQGMLEAWEGFDTSIAEKSTELFLGKTGVDNVEGTAVKVETPDPWGWEDGVTNAWSSEDPMVGIKQEDCGIGMFESFLAPPTAIGPSMTLPPISTQFSSLSWSEASSPPQVTDEPTDYYYPEMYVQSRGWAAIRPRSRTVPSPLSAQSSSSMSSSSKSSSPFSLPDPVPIRHSISTGSPSTSTQSRNEPFLPSTTLATLLQSMSVTGNGTYPSLSISPPQPCVSPLQTRCVPSPLSGTLAEKVVVHTCQPCHPAVTATHMEDIPVFQMMLGPFQLLRRIDSDFVNLSPIIAYSGTAGVATPTAGASATLNGDESNPSSSRLSPPSSSSPSMNVVTNATVITSGSPEICGTWVTLAAAQAYVRDHLAGEEREGACAALEVFLSDALVERFPSALQDFHRVNAGLRALNQFGKHFASTLMVAGGLGVLDCAVKISGGVSQQLCCEGSLGGIGEKGEVEVGLRTTSFGFGLVPSSEMKDVPLSKTEQDLFHELCVIPPDWDNKEGGMMALDEDEGFKTGVPFEQGKVEVDEQLMEVEVEVCSKGLNIASLRSTFLPSKRPSHSVRSASISSMSSLSSDDSDTLAHSTLTVVAKPALTTPKGRDAVLSDIDGSGANAEMMEVKDGRTLRRSKRVADAIAAAAHNNTPQATQSSTRISRSRKGGSRNSLS